MRDGLVCAGPFARRVHTAKCRAVRLSSVADDDSANRASGRFCAWVGFVRAPKRAPKEPDFFKTCFEWEGVSGYVYRLDSATGSDRPFFLRQALAAITPTLSRTSVLGSGTTLGAALITMLSRPTGLLQQGVAGLDSVIDSMSIGSAVFELAVANPPNVFGTVPLTAKIRAEFRKPWN
jgi:hypothetical protein